MSESQEKLGTFYFGILWVRRVRTQRIATGLSTCEKFAHVHASGVYGSGLWHPELWIWDILKVKCEWVRGERAGGGTCTGLSGQMKWCKKKKEKRKAGLEKVCDVTHVM